MGDPELEVGLRTLAEVVPKTDREIQDDLEDTTDDGRQISGYIVSHGNHNLAVYSSEGDEFFTLQYKLDIVPEAIRRQATQRYQAKHGPVQDDVDIQITQEDQEAAQQWLRQRIENLGDQQVGELNRKLTQLLSDPSCAYQIQSPFGAPTGFILRRKLFVYEDDFSASDFDRACQALVSVSMVPRQLLGRVYGTPEQNESTTQEAEETPTDSPRGFQ